MSDSDTRHTAKILKKCIEDATLMFSIEHVKGLDLNHMEKLMENAENFSDGKEILQPEELETFVKLEWSNIPLDTCGNLITKYKNTFGGCQCQEGFYNRLLVWGMNNSEHSIFFKKLSFSIHLFI